MTSTNRKPLVITAGEPAGIGPDLCLALAQSEWSDSIVVIADPGVIESRASMLGVSASGLTVLSEPLANPAVCGTPDPANAESLLAGLKRAVEGCTVRQVLDSYFADNETARSYVLDDQGCLRRHMMIFVDGSPVVDRASLGDAVNADSELFVIQALSGG